MDELEPHPQSVVIAIDDDRQTSGLLIRPEGATALYVFAHGAGAGMHHPFMEAAARGLSLRGVATLRFQFPFMEAGSRRPDTPKLAQATIRAAVTLAAELVPGAPLFAGGRSFGGRMTSKAQAQSPLPQVEGLIFLGFPLHAPKKPSTARADHLSEVHLPMLFIQGGKDALADLTLLSPVVSTLGADMLVIQGGDHGFHVPVRLQKSDQTVLDEILDGVRAWISSTLEARPPAPDGGPAAASR